MRDVFEIPKKIPGVSGKLSDVKLFGKPSHDVIGGGHVVRTRTLRRKSSAGSEQILRKIIGG